MTPAQLDQSFVTEQWLEMILEYRRLEKNIAALLLKRDEMRNQIGKGAAEAGYHNPTKENPVCFYDFDSRTLVSIERDSTNINWDVTFRDIPVHARER